MTDIDLINSMNRLGPASYKAYKSQDTCQLSGKGESKAMNFNRDDTTPIRFTPGREDKFSADNSEVGTRPAGDPKSSKNFQKILRKDPENKGKDGEEKMAAAVGDDEAEQSAMLIVEEQALKKKQAPISLFELSSRAAKEAQPLPNMKQMPVDNLDEKQFIAAGKNTLAMNDQISDDAQTESPAELYSKMTAKENELKKIDAHSEKVISRNDIAPATKSDDKQNKFNSRFATEQTDLSYVNPLALNTQSVQPITSISAEKSILPPHHIQDIIAQLVAKVVQLETSGRTDTVITLKHPPILAGADLVVTGFDSARGEFNITFQKLTQAAKTLLDMRVNQESLISALHQKGYAVHIVTTTTLAEVNLPPAEASPSQDRNRGQDQPKDQRQQDEPKDRR